MRSSCASPAGGAVADCLCQLLGAEGLNLFLRRTATFEARSRNTLQPGYVRIPAVNSEVYQIHSARPLASYSELFEYLWPTLPCSEPKSPASRK